MTDDKLEKLNQMKDKRGKIKDGYCPVYYNKKRIFFDGNVYYVSIRNEKQKGSLLKCIKFIDKYKKPLKYKYIWTYYGFKCDARIKKNNSFVVVEIQINSKYTVRFNIPIPWSNYRSFNTMTEAIDFAEKNCTKWFNDITKGGVMDDSM